MEHLCRGVLSLKHVISISGGTERDRDHGWERGGNLLRVEQDDVLVLRLKGLKALFCEAGEGIRSALQSALARSVDGADRLRDMSASSSRASMR
jgi:hypothetical protein